MARHFYLVQETESKRLLCNRKYDSLSTKFAALEDTSYSSWDRLQPIAFTTARAADRMTQRLPDDRLYTIIPVRVCDSPDDVFLSRVR